MAKLLDVPGATYRRTIVMTKKILAAKTATVAFAFSCIFSQPADAGGIPVIDVTNVMQTTISAINNVQSVQKQMAFLKSYHMKKKGRARHQLKKKKNRAKERKSVS